MKIENQYRWADSEERDAFQLARHIHNRAVREYNLNATHMYCYSLGCDPRRVAAYCEGIFPIAKVQPENGGRRLRIHLEKKPETLQTESEADSLWCSLQ